MRIGEIADQICVSKSILRYYESIRLIPHPGRDSCGYRSYSTADIERIRLVVGARLMGLSVADIRQVLLMQDEGKSPGPRLLGLLESKTKEVRKRMERLEAIEAHLVELHALGMELETKKAIKKGRNRGQA
jgi:DNA-binding transcriptional MerR regulator